MADDHAVATLAWDSISYGEQELERVPADKRGIYAFAVCRNSDVFSAPRVCPLHRDCGVRDSIRSLRDRYRDYLNDRKVMKRAPVSHV